MMETSRYDTIGELAAAEKINLPDASWLLRLTLLAPEMVEAILDGRELEGMKPPTLIEPMVTAWADQHEALRSAHR
jgi:hypothetical protein